MKGFESYLQRCVRTNGDSESSGSSSTGDDNCDWSRHYIDYQRLKSTLKLYYQRRRAFSKLSQQRPDGCLPAAEFRNLLTSVGNDHASSSTTTTGTGDVQTTSSSDYFEYVPAGDDSDESVALVDPQDALLRLSIQERQYFSQLLQEQLVDASSFYSKTLLPRLDKLICSLEKKQQASSSTSYTDLEQVAAREMMETSCFCVANIIVFRQLLIRYDAFCRTYNGMPLTEWYLQQQQQQSTSASLYSSSSTNEQPPQHFLVLDLLQQKDLAEYEMRLLQIMQQHEQDNGTSSSAQALTDQLQQLQILLEKTSNSVQRSVAGHAVFRDRVLGTVRQSILFGLQSYGIVMEPQVLVMRGRHLKQEIKALAKLREQQQQQDESSKQYAGVPPSSSSVASSKAESLASRLSTMEPENVLPLLLNLISCFLFMMNNYIIEPSSAYYANALGASDALSGIMIGAAPWFALVSAVAYSCWTNTSYKQPIVFAACLTMMGNFFYANAYSYQSMNMCLIGRAITGLGAPRVINRRYVADATPFSLRTAASAAFALSTALGAALGPGMAILLDLVTEFDFELPLVKVQTFNGMTGPGYFMCACWFLYTVAILLTFREPKRSGLDELRKRESNLGDSLLGEEEDDNEYNNDTDDDDDSDDEASVADGGVEEAAMSKTAAAAAAVPVDDELPAPQSSYCGCFQHITRPVALCMSLIFMKRIALESIVGSTSVITKNRYRWSITNVGLLHLVNGIIVIPVSILSGWLSTFFEDRHMAIWFLAITLFGMAFMFDPTDLVSHENETYNEGLLLAVGPIKYIFGSLIAFSGIEACESYVASLMSKVVPSALAVGTFNSGLLATLVGTSGRAVGDLFITLMGLISIRNLLNLLILPGAALVAISIALIRCNYKVLGV